MCSLPFRFWSSPSTVNKTHPLHWIFPITLLLPILPLPYLSSLILMCTSQLSFSSPSSWSYNIPFLLVFVEKLLCSENQISNFLSLKPLLSCPLSSFWSHYHHHCSLCLFPNNFKIFAYFFPIKVTVLCPDQRYSGFSSFPFFSFRVLLGKSGCCRKSSQMGEGTSQTTVLFSVWSVHV